MPDSIGFMGSLGSDGSVSDADFDQMHQPRSYGTPLPPAAASSPDTGSSAGSSSQPIQITVQALDAQSIMDRSDDIASAVNKAILTDLTDTISNL